MMAVRIAVPISVPFSEWVTSAEHYWITFAERRSVFFRILVLRFGLVAVLDG